MTENPDHPKSQITFGIIFISYLLAGIVTLFSSKYLPRIQLILGELFIIIPAVIYIFVKKYNFKSVFRINKINKNILIVSIAIGISISILTDEIDRIINKFVKMPPEIEDFIYQMLKVESIMDGIILFVAVVILAGIAEEMLFRGLLLKALENKLEIMYAIFLSALIFAFLHLTPWLIQVLLLGLILGFLSWRSNSIIPGIILHCFNNAFSLFLNNVNPETINWYNWNNHVNPPILVLAACMAYYGFMWFYRLTELDE